MTNEEFIDQIVAYYQESRKLSINPGKHNIWRGVSHSISSQAEDLFAFFVAEKLNDPSLEFIVDKHFSLRKAGMKTIQFRPDLAIVKNGLVTHIMDLKMDMGYKRRYHEMPAFKTLETNINKLRAGDFDELSYNNRNVVLGCTSTITYQIVVVSEKNEGKAKNREDIVEAISELNWVDIYYLTGDVHPNNYSDLKPTIRTSEFGRIIEDIKKKLP